MEKKKLKEKNQKTLQSKEALFLSELFNSLPKPKHPIFGILVGQVSKLVTLIDSSEEYQNWTAEILNQIKQNWKSE